MSLRDLSINKSWSLFLDRDGVINRRLPGAYVKTPEEFEIIAGVPEALRIMSEIFGRIIVVSNQQGIGKGLMTFEDLDKVHSKMYSLIEAAGGRLDAVFVAPMLKSDKHIMRKPKVGMGLAAHKQFPEISFKKSLMAGDSLSDMQFGKCLGMKTVLIGNAIEIARKFPRLVDFHFEDLLCLAKEIKGEKEE